MKITDQKEILIEIENILDGIDKCECDDDAGWWETSRGAAFGAKKLEEILSLFRKILEGGE